MLISFERCRWFIRCSESLAGVSRIAYLRGGALLHCFPFLYTYKKYFYFSSLYLQNKKFLFRACRVCFAFMHVYNSFKNQKNIFVSRLCTHIKKFISTFYTYAKNFISRLCTCKIKNKIFCKLNKKAEVISLG